MKYSLLVFILFMPGIVLCQKNDKQPRFFSNPIVVDSASTLMLPVKYNTDIVSVNKMVYSNEYYANIIFYNFATDKSKKLFKDDTFIKSFPGESDFYYRSDRPLKQNNFTERWVFYFVKEVDSNRNGRIDSDDPCILYVSDKAGDSLKSLTLSTENAVSINIFEKQGFALIKMQRDTNNDNNFDSKDKDYYYVRLDLDTLTLGSTIEVKDKI
jgi:hypothetical protein